MSTIRTLTAFSVALLVSSAANATLITFDSLHNTGQAPFVNDSALTFDGYTFTNDCGVANRCFVALGETFPFQSWLLDPKGAALENNYAYTTDTINRADGAAFNLVSMDMADLKNIGYETITDPFGKPLLLPTVLQFTFNYAAGGSSTQLVTLDNLPGGQTVSFAQNGLSSVSWVNFGSDFINTVNQFDNVVVTTAGAITPAVPEPETWALMVGGLALVGTAMRRRARA